MSSADSFSVFAEGTFSEQVQELVNYVVRNRSEEERTAFIRPFQDALKSDSEGKPLEADEERRKKILAMVIAEVKGLGEGSDKEIEGFFNLIYAHIFSLYSADSAETKSFIESLLQTVASASSEHASVQYRLLSNLFNATPRTSALRLSVYKTLLALASERDQLDILQLKSDDVQKWILEWDIIADESSAFLKSIVDAYTKADELETAYHYTLLHVRSLSTSAPSTEAAAIDAVATALRLPTVFDFDPLFKLDAVVAAKQHELFSLLHVFLNDGLDEFQAWQSSHPSVLEKYNLDATALQRKIRLLTLASLGFQHVGQEVAYTKIASALQIEVDQVEQWAIDVIRTGLLSGKLSQTTHTLHVSRSTARTFEREQWQALEKRLVAWKTGLIGVLEVVAAAQKQGGSHVAVPGASAIAV